MRVLPIDAPQPLLAKRWSLIIAIYVFNIVAAVLNNEISSRREGKAAFPREGEETVAFTGTERERESGGAAGMKQTGPMCVC